MATGFIIDHNLADSRYIIINLSWILWFTIPYAIWRKKIFYRLALILYFIAGCIEMAHWIILKGPLTITSLLVISNTNYQEAREFMDLKASLWLLVLIPYTVLFVFAFRRPPGHYDAKGKKYILAVLAFCSLAFIAENAVHGRLIRKGVPEVVKVGFSFAENIKLYREAMQVVKPRKVDATAEYTADSQTFVLILGESAARRHMSLYGADRNTNPRLKARNDVIVFNDAVSPYCNTLNAVLSILSQMNLENRIAFDKSMDIIDVMHSAGFKTYWLSNQSPIGIWDNLVTVFANKSDYCKFVNTSSNSSFEATYTSSFDDKLFDPLVSALHEKVKRKFIVLHLMGSHSSYSKRYPSEYKAFTGNTSKEKTIAEYDNSMLYNDFIVDSLLKIIQSGISAENNLLTSIIYLSDHAENVYDEQDYCGHDFSGSIPRSIVEIPFLVWLSPEYIKLYPEKVSSIKANADKPFVTDDLFHDIMDINGIKSSYFDEKRSVFNPNFNASRTRILEDGKDYDH